MIARAARSFLGTAAAALDEVATRAASRQVARRRQRSPQESLSHPERLAALAAIRARYDELSAQPYFRAQRQALAPALTGLRSLDHGGRVIDMRWPSNYQPLLPEIAERYLNPPDNARAAARLWLHPQPRPVAVLIHGYLGGRHAVEEEIWPSAWFYRLGLDLAFFVLPFHGDRAAPGKQLKPPFPSNDPRISNEGFRQAMADLQDLISWLLQRGHPQVGAMGMSLGGYSTALAATLDERLAFAVPIIPLTSLADFARDQGRLGDTALQTAAQHQALDAAHRPVSPLHRPALIDRERVLIIAAEADRITPMRHAERLADHFQAPLTSWHGGHLLQFGRAGAFREVGRLLNRLAVVEDERGR